MDARKTIQLLYEEARQDGQAAYDPERLLAYLTAPPASRGGRCAETFRARRRYVRFMESVQLTFRICFTNQEWDRAYTMDDFCLLVEKKSSQRKVALGLAERRVTESRNQRLGSTLKFAVLSSPLILGAFSTAHTLLRILLLIGWLGVVGGIAFVTWRELSYSRKLLRRIREQPLEST